MSVKTNQQPTTDHDDITRVYDYDIDLSRMLYMLHLEVDGLIKQADVKAQVLLGLDTFIIAAVASTTAPYVSGFPGAGILAQPPLRITGLIITALAVIALINSVLFALRTITPRVLRQSYTQPNTFFFGSIANLSPDQYIDTFMDMPLQHVKRDVMLQIHNKSKIIEQKLSTVRVSTQSVLLGVLLWVIGLVVLVFSG